MYRSARFSPRPGLLGRLAFGAMVAAAALVAAPANAEKVARDLQSGISATRASARWARDVNGARQVQVIITTNGTDPSMSDLRSQIVRGGGSVHTVFPSLYAVTAQVNANQVQVLSQRKDVISIAPNRETQRTASTLESITGSLTSNVRGSSSKTSYSGLDGTGIGIAVLDSGVMRAHEAFLNGTGTSRVKRNVNMLNNSVANWTTGVNYTTSLAPNSYALSNYENSVANDNATVQDGYGHGTHVASVAAGRARTYSSGTPDTTGIAPNADIYDVRVLNDSGVGSLSDALEGIEWVIYHAKEYNIRVLNVSLAAGSTDSWQTDPLCVAVRSAVAAGITVVVAAGNFGQSTAGQQIYGAISSPGNDPSVITVGAVNFQSTTSRGDDSVNYFSSRGPTRGSYTDTSGVKHVDNLLKPDLVAPGNKVVSAAATAASSTNPSWNYLAANNYSALVSAVGITQKYQETQMMLSGTSIAAPVVAGAAALLLQANPGLTPPLVKAILQYTAQPLPNFNLLQQGAGYLNIDGAVTLANVLRTDLNTAISAGTISVGASMLANGKSMPGMNSSINGANASWSRIAFVGGNSVVSGLALFQKYQPIYDPRITWANGTVRFRQPIYWSGTGITAGTYPKYFTDVAMSSQALISYGVVSANALAGNSSMTGKTGVFMPTATLSGWLAGGSGTTLGQGVVLSEGMILSEGLILSEGMILSEGLVLSEGLILSEGLVLSEGMVLSEAVYSSIVPPVTNQLRSLLTTTTRTTSVDATSTAQPALQFDSNRAQQGE